VESKIDSVFKSNNSKIFFDEEDSSLNNMMSLRQDLLAKEEATWRLKIHGSGWQKVTTIPSSFTNMPTHVKNLT